MKWKLWFEHWTAVEGESIIESNPSMSHGVTVVRAIVCLKNGLISLRILNPRNCSIPLKKGTAFARMEHIKGPVVNLSAVRGTDISTAAQETLLFLGVEGVGSFKCCRKGTFIYIVM